MNREGKIGYVTGSLLQMRDMARNSTVLWIVSK